MAATVEATAQKTLLALGAHYDDCPFGIPGVLIEAAQRGYRVVILNLIGDYSNFAPATDRSKALMQGTIEINQAFGAETRFLGWKGHHFRDTVEAAQEVAQVVADIRPQIAFLLWPHDRHQDHVSASRICETALRHAGSLLNLTGYRPPRAFYYDNGPRHTIGFEPDTYVDVSTEWEAAREWLARLMRLAFGERFESDAHPAVTLKETLGAYRGAASGVHRAEALRSLNVSPVDIL
jgi:LmbE family N-acetylglucosaminyl deacetylase